MDLRIQTSIAYDEKDVNWQGPVAVEAITKIDSGLIGITFKNSGADGLLVKHGVGFEILVGMLVFSYPSST